MKKRIAAALLVCFFCGRNNALEAQVPDFEIEVRIDVGGTLYFQDEMVAVLGENITLTIPVERPGTYAVRMDLGNGASMIRRVTVAAQGITKLAFTRFEIGDRGPGGGIIFFADERMCMEVSGILGELSWDDAVAATRNYRGGGYADWRMPTKNELNLIYQNLRAKRIGNLGNAWHWSSSEYSGTNAWDQRFSDGAQYGNDKITTISVRAIRVFDALAAR
jgi:hypothetical protein